MRGTAAPGSDRDRWTHPKDDPATPETAPTTQATEAVGGWSISLGTFDCRYVWGKTCVSFDCRPRSDKRLAG